MTIEEKIHCLEFIRRDLETLSDLWYDMENRKQGAKREHDELYDNLDASLKECGLPLGMETAGTYEDIADAVTDTIIYYIWELRKGKRRK